MKQKLLIGAAFCGSLLMMSGSGFVYGQTCTASPSCTELGYTKTQSECGEDGIKCPFGNLWSCSNECEKAGFIYTCTGTGYSSGSGIACNNKYSMCNCEMEYEWKEDGCKANPDCNVTSKSCPNGCASTNSCGKCILCTPTKTCGGGNGYYSHTPCINFSGVSCSRNYGPSYLGCIPSQISIGTYCDPDAWRRCCENCDGYSHY